MGTKLVNIKNIGTVSLKHFWIASQITVEFFNLTYTERKREMEREREQRGNKTRHTNTKNVQEQGGGGDKGDKKGFFACYLLTSLSPRHKGHTYIGFDRIFVFCKILAMNVAILCSVKVARSSETIYDYCWNCVVLRYCLSINWIRMLKKRK